MTAQLHQASVYALFDAMPVPLLTFAVSGVVTYANSAAKNHPGRPVESMSGQAAIKSLPLVQRIVGLHGGQMRLSTTEQDTVQVLMEFPTDAPQRGQAELSVAQAQRYAQDLAQLMSRRKKENV